ncbi:hypothetical protein RJ639_040409 [Escallonia herrerae]|uniref:DUF4283 domain-containing protein n=1 Tax=Escallonia herrerae TaxID=1293975 RepID=A0AA89B7F4_9ASTE|nr:hypothetical protein RJ639_040409 [Escallonia herrerae]
MIVQHQKENIFCITFKHKWDRKRVLDSGPWSIRNSHVVVRDWPLYLTMEEIDFSQSTFWLQISLLLPNMMSKANAEKIGSKIGTILVIVFSTEGKLSWFKFLRLQKNWLYKPNLMAKGWRHEHQIFHLSTIIRRRQNAIEFIKDREGKWISNHEKIGACLNGNFYQLFKTSNPSFPLDLDCLITLVLFEEDITMLNAIPTDNEITSTLKHFEDLKAPGPNGMPTIFYKSY